MTSKQYRNYASKVTDLDKQITKLRNIRQKVEDKFQKSLIEHLFKIHDVLVETGLMQYHITPKTDYWIKSLSELGTAISNYMKFRVPTDHEVVEFSVGNGGGDVVDRIEIYPMTHCKFLVFVGIPIGVFFNLKTLGAMVEGYMLTHKEKIKNEK